MAFVYKQLEITDSDMVDPEDFNTNMRELANEYNGMLDRDNFKENEFGIDEIQKLAFTRVLSKTRRVARYAYGESTSFSDDILSIEYESPHDGMLICEWSGDVEFFAPPTKNNTAPTKAQILTIRLSVNGSEIGKVLRVSGARYRVPLYMVGAIPISPGRVVVNISAMTGSMEHASNKVTSIPTSYVQFHEQHLVAIHRRR